LGWKQSYDNWFEYYGAIINNGIGETTLRCYTLDFWKSIFHSFNVFNISLFQLICANDEMGLMSRMNSYIKTLC
jgi:hypothetical protein